MTTRHGQHGTGGDVRDGRGGGVSKPNTDHPVQNLDVIVAMATHRRPREQYGGIVLSIQANAYAYCEPRQHNLPIESYTTVEVALWREGNGDWLLPSEIGFDGADEYWEERSPQSGATIGAYVPREIADQLREHLKQLAKHAPDCPWLAVLAERETP